MPTSPTITCVRCGCLNFSRLPTCDHCRQTAARPPSQPPSRSFAPTPRQPQPARPQTHPRHHQSHPRQSQSGSYAHYHRSQQDHQSQQRHHHQQQQSEQQPHQGLRHTNPQQPRRALYLAARGPPMPPSGRTEATIGPVRINRPGSAVFATTTTTTTTAPRSATGGGGNGTSHSSSTATAASTTTTTSSSHTTTKSTSGSAASATPVASTNGSLIGNKRPRADKPVTTEVIDLISSDDDEEEQDQGREAGKDSTGGDRQVGPVSQAARVAATGSDISRLALRSLTLPPNHQLPAPPAPPPALSSASSARRSPSSGSSAPVAEVGPFQGREFPTVSFQASDFPSITPAPSPTTHRVSDASSMSAMASRPVPPESTAVSTAPSGDGVSDVAAPTPSPAASPTQMTSNVDDDPMTQAEVVLIDDDDEEANGEIDDDSDAPLLPPLFQSRRFATVAFKENDFLSLQEGYLIARRTLAPGAPPQQTPAEPAASATPVASTDGDKIKPESNGTTSGAASEMDPANILHPRSKKKSEPTPEGSTSSSSPQVVSSELTPAPIVVHMIKPSLGHCGVEFLHFMRNCIDGDDDDEVLDEDDASFELLDVVDLTAATDESGDDDDDEEDDMEIHGDLQPTQIVGSVVTNHHNVPIPATAVDVSPTRRDAPNGTIGGVQIQPVKRRRAPRPKETCMLCEEKAWIRALIKCPACNKFYHKRCAREYGDDSVCWNCDLDGMIDDSELTDDHKTEVVGMLSTLRQSPESDVGEEDAQDAIGEDSNGLSSANNAAPALMLNGTSTKSMRRWKEFLDVSTAKVEPIFNAVTTQITRELQDQVGRQRYSKGFASKEDVEAAMSEVLDHFADLQEKAERAKAMVTAASLSNGSTAPASLSASPTDATTASVEAPPGRP